MSYISDDIGFKNRLVIVIAFYVGIFLLFSSTIYLWHQAVERGRQRHVHDEAIRLADPYRNRLWSGQVCSQYCDHNGHLGVREWSRGYDCTCMTKLVNEQ